MQTSQVQSSYEICVRKQNDARWVVVILGVIELLTLLGLPFQQLRPLTSLVFLATQLALFVAFVAWFTAVYKAGKEGYYTPPNDRLLVLIAFAGVIWGLLTHSVFSTINGVVIPSLHLVLVIVWVFSGPIGYDYENH